MTTALPTIQDFIAPCPRVGSRWFHTGDAGRGEKLAHGQQFFCSGLSAVFAVVCLAAFTIGFCGGSDAYFSICQRALAVDSPQPRAGYFHRPCGGIIERGQPDSETDKMLPTNTVPLLACKRPLISLHTAADVLDKSHQQVLDLIEDGALLFAWDFGTGHSHRKAVRILAQSLIDYQRGQSASSLPAREQFAHAVSLIFPMSAMIRPGAVAKLRAHSIAFQFGIKSDHFLELVDSGLLRVAASSPRRRGPGGSPYIEFSSVVEFLKKRRIA